MRCALHKIFHRKNMIFLLKIMLPVLYILTLAFIFGNSLQTGEESAQMSNQVVETVQEVVKIIAPQSPIATATGEDYERLHTSIRVLAHFTEFALLGMLACGCFLVYIQDCGLDKRYWLIGALSVVIVPCIDEWLQSFTANRAAEWADIWVDLSGGCIGFALILACFYGVVWILQKRKEKQMANI